LSIVSSSVLKEKETKRNVPEPMFIDETRLNKSSVQYKEEKSPVHINPPVVADFPDCLVVSCTELVALFEIEFGFKVEESFLEEAAIQSIKKSVLKWKEGKGKAFKFIFIDLDDPTLMLGRFTESLNEIFAANPSLKIEVFACASTTSERMLKKCEELKVKFVAKPIYE
jgi:hypothetical protein